MKAILFFILSTVSAFAAAPDIHTVNVGTAANDGTGDTVRTAFSKINTNLLVISNSIVSIVSGGAAVTNTVVTSGATPAVNALAVYTGASTTNLGPSNVTISTNTGINGITFQSTGDTNKTLTLEAHPLMTTNVEVVGFAYPPPDGATLGVLSSGGKTYLTNVESGGATIWTTNASGTIQATSDASGVTNLVTIYANTNLPPVLALNRLGNLSLGLDAGTMGASYGTQDDPGLHVLSILDQNPSGFGDITVQSFPTSTSLFNDFAEVDLYAKGATTVGGNDAHVYAAFDVANGAGALSGLFLDGHVNSFTFNIDLNNTTVTLMRPSHLDGNTPYIFDTSVAHTSGNLFEVKNNGTTVDATAAISGWTGAGTKYKVDDGTYRGLKMTDYLLFVYPGRVDGTGCTIATNDYTSSLWGLATYAGTGGTNANFATFKVGPVPADLDTGVTMILTNLALRVSGTDTGSASFTIGYFQPASSSAASPSDFTALSGYKTFTTGTLTSPVSGDVFYVSGVTLTGWAAALTPGRFLTLGIARNGSDANNDAISLLGGSLAYGRSQ